MATKQKTIEEMIVEATDLKRQLLSIRIKNVTSTEERDTSKPKKLRRDIARLKTLINITKSNA